MNRLFITGMGRSGTTLLDKLLSNHDDIELISQPFPLVFTELKKIFLNNLGISKYYVLNDNCFEGDYDIEQFNDFLTNYKFHYSDIEQIFEKMKVYSGQMTNLKLNIPYQDTYSFLELYDAVIKNNLLKKELKYFGSKEIMCEEFIPYLLKNDTKIILIIRDPRDVVSSINYPRKQKYLGDKKPTLFILESWRRTIDYLSNYKLYPNIISIRYEDLVSEPYIVLNKISKFLNLKSFKLDHFANGILDRDGQLWQANTSFENTTSFISTKSIGGYKDNLSNDEIHYIETICKKEMLELGYKFQTIPNKDIINSFKDYGIDEIKHLNKDYSSIKENIDREIKRYEKS